MIRFSNFVLLSFLIFLVPTGVGNLFASSHKLVLSDYELPKSHPLHENLEKLFQDDQMFRSP